jgi:hypothetical protein
VESTAVIRMEINGRPVGLASLIEATLKREDDNWSIVVVSQYSSDLVDSVVGGRYPDPVAVFVVTESGERFGGEATATRTGDLGVDGQHVEVLLLGVKGSLRAASR